MCIKTSDSTLDKSTKPETDTAAPAEGLARKERRRKERVAWSVSDLVTLLSLAALLLPSWILPESWWAPLWRGGVRLRTLAKRGSIRRNGKMIERALGDVGPDRARAIALGLRAAVYEVRCQDLRAWRPSWKANSKGGWSPRLSLEGEAHLAAALQGGKGAVLWVSPSVFNSLPTKIALDQRGYKVSHLSSPEHGVSETKFGVEKLNRVRSIPEDRYLKERIVFDSEAPTTSMRKMMRALKAGEVVSIVAANTEGYEVALAPIFGGLLPVAVGAPRLAALTGAPLLPTFVFRDPDLGFRIAIEAPIPLDPKQPADERTLAAATEYLRRSEPWVRRYPEQWRAWSKLYL